MAVEPTSPPAGRMTDERRAAFRLFAQAHLRSRAERAVYVALPPHGTDPLSVAELCAAAHLDHHDTDQVLRRFAAAGVAEVVEARGERRYRLRREAAGGVVDPVCGMVVPPGSGHEVDGDLGVARFCSVQCLMTWRSAGGRPAGNP